MENGHSSPRRSAGATRSEASHQAIVAAARQVLAEKGYAGFSFEAVARLAGASKPTLYRWWPNKAQLIAEVYEVEATHIAIPAHYPVRERMEMLLNALWTLWHTTLCGVAFRSFIAESQHDKENMALLREAFLNRRLALPQEILATAIAQGELPPDTDTALMLKMLFGFCWLHLLTDNLGDTSPIAPFVDYLFGRVPRLAGGRHDPSSPIRS